MNIAELQGLDFNDAGSWPNPAKLGAIAILCFALVATGFYFDTQDQIGLLEVSQNKETELKSIFEVKQAKSVNLEAYQNQLEEMRKSFGAMLRQLPNRTEVAELLVDVSQTGLSSGLEFELFEPQAEEPKEFYAELPIKIRVVGQYHEFGSFVSGLASLPRIVTLHDLEISVRPDEKNKKAPSSLMVMEATARTYRYLDEEGEQEIGNDG